MLIWNGDIVSKPDCVLLDPLLDACKPIPQTVLMKPQRDRGTSSLFNARRHAQYACTLLCKFVICNLHEFRPADKKDTHDYEIRVTR